MTMWIHRGNLFIDDDDAHVGELIWTTMTVVIVMTVLLSRAAWADWIDDGHRATLIRRSTRLMAARSIRYVMLWRIAGRYQNI